MEAYANALLIAIPCFMVLLLLEIFYGYYRGRQTYVFMDTISSLSSGLTNILKDSLGLVIVLVSYPWLTKHLAVLTIESSLWLYIVAFICIDFASYWSHRLNHKINFFWNQHVIHHSSEEFNMACALRQSVSNILGYGALFLIPAAFLGVPNEVIATLAPLHLFGQFWYHTQHIGKLGWLEYIIVTPSQHRVHHAINPLYIDKNLSAIFCVWDRIFGTFQEELDDEPPVYGVLKPVKSWNPLWINFQHLWGLITDAWFTKDPKAKFTIWFKPTGWRPEDMKQRHPRSVITDIYTYKKFNSGSSTILKYWAAYHLLATLGLLLQFLFYFGELDFKNGFITGLLLFVAIFSYTSVMDRFTWSRSLEWTRLILTLVVIVVLGGTFIPLMYWTWLFYILLSIVALLVLTLNSKV